MSAKGKKWHEENALFLSKKTGKLTYNSKCNRCVNDCKQSYMAILVCCPFYCKK